MTPGPREFLRRLALTVGVGAALFGQMQAPVFAGGDDNGGKGDACAAERAPLVERQKQYQAIHHSHLGAALAKGLEAGAMFAAGQMLGHVLPGPFSFGGGGGGGSGVGFSFFTPGNLSEASKLAIPGVTVGGGSFGSNDARAIAAMAVVVAVVSSVEAYAQLKEEEAGGDRIKLANSIDDDARRQAEVTRSIAADEAALDACRARQVDNYKARLTSASNDRDRRTLARDRSSLQTALKSDVDLTSGVVDQQASLAKTYTQSRAMSENTSEATVLGGQAPAYEATASTAPLKLPPPPKGATAKGAPATPATPSGPLKRGGGVIAAPAAPPAPVYTASRALIVRAAASAKAKAVANIAAGATVSVTDGAAVPAGWTQVSVNGASGYVQTALLTKTVPVNTGPQLVPPSNIRDHNRAVIAARDQGPNRLKTLLTDVQAG